jgi:hypothetical protein
VAELRPIFRGRKPSGQVAFFRDEPYLITQSKTDRVRPPEATQAPRSIISLEAQMARTPIVFVPGLLCSAGIFGPQIAALWPYGPVHVASTLEGSTIAEIASSILAAAPPSFAAAASRATACAPSRCRSRWS